MIFFFFLFINYLYQKTVVLPGGAGDCGANLRIEYPPLLTPLGY